MHSRKHKPIQRISTMTGENSQSQPQFENRITGSISTESSFKVMNDIYVSIDKRRHDSAHDIFSDSATTRKSNLTTHAMLPTKSDFDRNPQTTLKSSEFTTMDLEKHFLKNGRENMGKKRNIQKFEEDKENLDEKTYESVVDQQKTQEGPISYTKSEDQDDLAQGEALAGPVVFIPFNLSFNALDSQMEYEVDLDAPLNAVMENMGRNT